MKSLFYAPDIALNPELPEEESQHCIRVLRQKEGDHITITDGKGFFYSAIVMNTHPKHCRVNIIEQSQAKPLWTYTLHIAVAPTKNIDRMEWLVEKATEIGIDTITCLHCRYSERNQIKLQRLHKIAVNAMKQSQKAILPQINGMMDFSQFITQPFNGCKMIAHCADDHYDDANVRQQTNDKTRTGDERTANHRLMKTGKQLIRNYYTPGDNALILIGPEGDFSHEEIDAAYAAGFVPVSLGESRLRTETAAWVACHTIHLLNQ